MRVECPCLQMRRGEGALTDTSPSQPQPPYVKPAREWTSISSEVSNSLKSSISHFHSPLAGRGLCIFSAVFTALESVYVTQM